MKIIITCASKKYEHAGRLKNTAGDSVVFVAHPEKYVSAGQFIACKPDDKVDNGKRTWREHLNLYNQQGSNPDKLFRAAELYKPPIYLALVEKYGWKNIFILSAGWGLVRSDFLLPYYDITFSNQGKSWSKRRPRDSFQDFDHLSENTSQGETVYFFGGKDYLSLYYSLTQNIPARKVIYYAQGNPTQVRGYEYIPYRSGTNWHYSCAKEFMAGTFPC